VAHNAVRWIDRGLLRIEQTVLGAGILGIAALSIANVAARNFWGGSLPFVEELNQALALWVTFAGVGLGARRARHIRMAAFYEQLRGPARKVAWLVVAGGTSLLLLVLAGLAFRYVETARAIGGVTPALRISLWLIYLIVPAGLALGALEYALTLYRNLTAPGIYASIELEEREAETEAPA
jgi:C4-dicarboxylate transporter DctQ subunit